MSQVVRVSVGGRCFPFDLEIVNLRQSGGHSIFKPEPRYKPAPNTEKGVIPDWTYLGRPGTPLQESAIHMTLASPFFVLPHHGKDKMDSGQSPSDIGTVGVAERDGYIVLTVRSNHQGSSIMWKNSIPSAQHVRISNGGFSATPPLGDTYSLEYLPPAPLRFELPTKEIFVPFGHDVTWKAAVVEYR